MTSLSTFQVRHFSYTHASSGHVCAELFLASKNRTAACLALLIELKKALCVCNCHAIHEAFVTGFCFCFS